MNFSKLRTGLPVALALFIGGTSVVLSQTPAQNGEGLAAALSAASSGDWESAAQIAAQNQDPIAVEVIEWTRLRDGTGDFVEYEAFLKTNSDWPGLPLLQKVSEKSIPPDLDPQRVINYFAAQRPQTGWGALRLGLAYEQLGRHAEAAVEIKRAWAEFSISQAEQDALLEAFPKTLKSQHANRLDALLWRRKVTEAGRMLSLVSPSERQLAEVRNALQLDKNGVDAMISALPEASQNAAGLAIDRFRWRVSKD